MVKYAKKDVLILPVLWFLTMHIYTPFSKFCNTDFIVHLIGCRWNSEEIDGREENVRGSS